MADFLSQLNLSREESVFAARIEDCCELCDRNNVPKFTGFLDLRQQKIAEYSAGGVMPGSFSFYGGYEGAERKMFGVFPDYISDRINEYPISYLCVSHSRPLTHRDFLGSLMSLGIKREIIGDIVVGEEKSYIIIQSSMCDHVIDNISKIGNVGVRIEISDGIDLSSFGNRFEENSVIVSSMRLDCVVAALTSKSRSDSAKFVTSERVSVNHEIITSCSKCLGEGDVISIRSFGKFIIGACTSKTKKGRIVLLYKKYI